MNEVQRVDGLRQPFVVGSKTGRGGPLLIKDGLNYYIAHKLRVPKKQNYTVYRCLRGQQKGRVKGHENRCPWTCRIVEFQGPGERIEFRIGLANEISLGILI